MKKIYLGGLALLVQTAVVFAQNGNNGQENDQDNGGIGWFLAVFLFIVLVIWLVRRNNRRNSDVYYNQGPPPVYNNGPGYNGHVIIDDRPGVGDFVAGAIVGAAAAEIMEDIVDGSNYNQPQGGFDDSNYSADTSSYNQDDNDNNWDSGNDSSFSDDSFNDDSNF